jgi:hypothetical protein
MEWKITKSADAPWENGCSEALIKSLKNSLVLAVGQSIMTFSELQTVIIETNLRRTIMKLLVLYPSAKST